MAEALHRFFACDDPSAPDAGRLALADGLCERWGAPQLSPRDMVAASNRLTAFVEHRFAGAIRFREWPVHAEEELQVISGRLDMLIDDDGGFAIIDHKSFPGVIQLDSERLRSFGGQVSLYSRALVIATGRRSSDYWIHQPIAGTMTRVTIG